MSDANPLEDAVSAIFQNQEAVREESQRIAQEREAQAAKDPQELENPDEE